MLILEDNVATANYLAKMLHTLFPQEKAVAFHTIAEGRKWLKDNHSSFALIDIGMPDGSGLTFLREFKKKNLSAIAIIVSSFSDDENIFKALSEGADGYILKDEDEKIAIHTLEKIRNGEPPLSPEIALRMMKHFRRDQNQKDLSPREMETLRLISMGHTISEASKELGIGHQTVAGYVKSIYQKLHVSSRAEATREAIKRGLI